MKYLDQTQFDSIYAMLEGIKAAADDGATESCKRLAHACTLTMTELNIQDEDRHLEGRNKAG